jgi:hypothetical protein
MIKTALAVGPRGEGSVDQEGPARVLIKTALTVSPRGEGGVDQEGPARVLIKTAVAVSPRSEAGVDQEGAARVLIKTAVAVGPRGEGGVDQEGAARVLIKTAVAVGLRSEPNRAAARHARCRDGGGRPESGPASARCCVYGSVGETGGHRLAVLEALGLVEDLGIDLAQLGRVLAAMVATEEQLTAGRQGDAHVGLGAASVTAVCRGQRLHGQGACH